MKNKWKVIAWIFIVLCILETILIICAYNVGTNMIENENRCSLQYCGLGDSYSPYDAYAFDTTSNTCYCYTGNEITKTAILD